MKHKKRVKPETQARRDRKRYGDAPEEAIDIQVLKRLRGCKILGSRYDDGVFTLGVEEYGCVVDLKINLQAWRCYYLRGMRERSRGALRSVECQGFSDFIRQVGKFYRPNCGGEMKWIDWTKKKRGRFITYMGLSMVGGIGMADNKVRDFVLPNSKWIDGESKSHVLQPLFMRLELREELLECLNGRFEGPPIGGVERGDIFLMLLGVKSLHKVVVICNDSFPSARGCPI